MLTKERHPQQFGYPCFGRQESHNHIPKISTINQKRQRTLLQRYADRRRVEPLHRETPLQLSTWHSSPDPLCECAFLFTFFLDGRRRSPLPRPMHLSSSVVAHITC
jgi:hypothetical protein